MGGSSFGPHGCRSLETRSQIMDIKTSTVITRPTLSSLKRVDLQPLSETQEPKESVQFGDKGYDVYKDPSPWDSQFSKASLISQSDQQATLSGVRWGYEEKGERSEWKPQVRDTTIPKEALTEVYIATEPFLKVGHSDLVFEFDQPITSADGRQDKRLALSVEAYRHEGQPYKPWKGHSENYGLVYQFGSFKDRVQHATRKLGRPIELRKLKLSSEEKKKLLNLALEEGVKDRTGDYYHTTRDSCYTGALNLIERATEKSLDRWAVPKVLLKPTMFVPTLTALAMDDRGLLADSQPEIYQPDVELHPGKQGKPSFYDPLVHKLSSDSPKLWKRAFQAVGSGLGLTVASQLGMGWLGTAATVLATGASSGVLADHLRLSAGQQYIEGAA